MTGNFASGVRVARVEADPAMITISGPSKEWNAWILRSRTGSDATGVMKVLHDPCYVSDPACASPYSRANTRPVMMEEASARTQGTSHRTIHQ